MRPLQFNICLVEQSVARFNMQIPSWMEAAAEHSRYVITYEEKIMSFLIKSQIVYVRAA